MTANGHPVLYTANSVGGGGGGGVGVAGLTEQNNLRNCYDRMQFAEGMPYAQFIPQQGPVVSATGSNISYMTTTLPLSSVNFTAPSSVGAELTYADLGVIGAGGALIGSGGGVGGIPGKKMQYTTATLGRPPRHPDLKRHEPTIYAQVS